LVGLLLVTLPHDAKRTALSDTAVSSLSLFLPPLSCLHFPVCRDCALYTTREIECGDYFRYVCYRVACFIISKILGQAFTVDLAKLHVHKAAYDKDKSKHHIMKAYWVSGAIAPRILSLLTRRKAQSRSTYCVKGKR